MYSYQLIGRGLYLLLGLALLLAVANSPLRALAQVEPMACKKGDFSWRREALLERKICVTLGSPTTLEFIETPLKDVVEYLKDLHGIDIQIDTKALDGVGVSSDTPITCNLTKHTLRTALRIILRKLDLTYMVRGGMLTITTPEIAQYSTYMHVFPATDLLTDAAAADSLAKAADLILDPPQEAGDKVKAPLRVVPFRGLLLVNATSPEHERVDELLTEIRRKLKLPEFEPPHPLEGWRPGESVDLSGLGLRNADLVYLKDQLQIRQLALAENEIGDGGAMHLRGLRELEILTLAKNRLTHDGCLPLAALVKLKELDLSGNRIGDKGVAQIKGLVELRKLNLSRTDVTDAGLLHLAALSNLRYLTIGGAREPALSPAAIDKLRKSLPKCSISDAAQLGPGKVAREPDPFAP